MQQMWCQYGAFLLSTSAPKYDAVRGLDHNNAGLLSSAWCACYVLTAMAKSVNVQGGFHLSVKHYRPSPDIAGVAGYTWVAIIHVLLGFSFKTTLNIANLTSVAWLLCYYFLLKPLVRAPEMHSIASCNAFPDFKQTLRHFSRILSLSSCQCSATAMSYHDVFSGGSRRPAGLCHSCQLASLHLHGRGCPRRNKPVMCSRRPYAGVIQGLRTSMQTHQLGLSLK